MGWQNTVLRVDLSSGKISREALNTQWAEQYLGQRGLATRYLWEEMDPAADAMSAENVLIFASGPLTGTIASTSGRYSVITKSPLTGGVACSNSGGKFGAEMKFAGYDMLIFTGHAEEPVYLHIEDDRVELCSAAEIAGTSVWDTDAWLKHRHQDPELKIAAIGVAGERGVRYACVVNDLHRAAGRSGVGAVMGSKNLKAICVRGRVGVRVDDAAAFLSAAGEANEILHGHSSRRGLSKYGTHEMLDSMQEFGGLPTNNFNQVQFDKADEVNAHAVRKPDQNGHTNLKTNAACFGCTIACGRIAKIDPQYPAIKDRKQYQKSSGGLEYETAFAFGPVIGVSDLNALTLAGFMMNEHGVDPISFGVTLAAAMELYEEGVIDSEITDGIELKFGNAEALVVMAEKTGTYQGFGQQLALGSKRLCEKYGRPELAMVAKGQEFAGYDSRALQGMGLGYATSNRGACHLRHDTFGEDMRDQTAKGKAIACKESQDFVSVVDSSGLCLFTTSAWGIDQFSRMLSTACPGDWSEQRLLETGERIWNLERLFNLKAGLSATDDSLPKRMTETPAPSGTAKGKVSELKIMMPEYYALRGWGTDGVPSAETLQRLGIEA